MGKVIEGRWVGDDVAATNADGSWTREDTVCRDFVRADGSTAYAPEAGRYHLWLAWNCTWSQRTMIARNLLGLGGAISFSLAHWHRNEGGWWFREGVDALQPDAPQPRENWDRERGFSPADPEQGLSLWKVYAAGDSKYTGRATVPVLWDRARGEVVSNESKEILRMVETEFAAIANDIDLVPADLLENIEATNAWIYEDINNGVYRVGFASSQSAYAEALSRLFAALDRAEERLAGSRYLCGDRLTEADLRLFPTLVRFDPVYYAHFKCNLRRICDYPNLGNYLRDLYQTPGFAETVRVDLYQLGYMGRSERLNPSRIIPGGPALDWDAPHDRDRLGPRRMARRGP
jgi:putative glutathione S-transferase